MSDSRSEDPGSNPGEAIIYKELLTYLYNDIYVQLGDTKMLRVISAEIKPTGYLCPDMPGNERLRKWEDIEKDREELRQAARKSAEKKAEELGHKMRPWSNVNLSRCSVCNRQIKITNIISRLSTKYSGPALEQQCDHTDGEKSNDTWHWEFNAYME